MKFSSAMMLALAVAVLACAVSPSDAKVILVNMPNPAPAGYRVMAVWEAEFRQAELRALMSQWSICALSGGSASGWGYATAKAPAALQSPDERSSGCVFMTNDIKTAVITTLENTVSGRYAFDVNGKSVHPYAREQEGGWTKAPQAMLMSNATNTKAIWVIIPVPGIAGGYFIQNMATNRYMFDTGNTKTITKRGSEGGWLSAPAAVTADANYYNLAVWRFESVKGMDGVFFIVNAITKRLLFNSNLPANKWPIVANIVTADDNYYGNAEWRIAGLKL